jgi:glycosyltransferase involved in cell wall biosynthesis
MRIAMVGQKTHVWQFGGIERHVGLLAERLAERGHDVTVFVRPGYAGHSENGSGSLRTPLRPCLPSKHLEAITHTSLCALEAALRGYDVIHFHAVGPSLVIPLAHVRRGPVVCATIHDQDYNKDKWSSFARWMLRLGEASACRYADAVIVVARYLQAHLRLARGRETVYIPNGSDPLTVRPASDFLRGVGLEPERYLLFMARLVPEKGCDVLIKAFRASSTPYHLAIAGGSSHSDEHERELHRLAGDDPRIRFLGFQSGEALDELRSHAAAYVMPSRQEGLPLSLLEALWYGMPVIASDIPAVHEVDGAVPEQITLVAPGDEEALRIAIEALPAQSGPKAAGALLWPTWADVAERVEEVYLDTLEGRRASSRGRASVPAGRP